MINLLLKFYFDVFLPSVIPYVIITCLDSYEVTRIISAPTAELGLKEADVKICDNVEICNSCNDVVMFDNSDTSNNPFRNGPNRAQATKPAFIQ